MCRVVRWEGASCPSRDVSVNCKKVHFRNKRGGFFLVAGGGSGGSGCVEVQGSSLRKSMGMIICYCLI